MSDLRLATARPVLADPTKSPDPLETPDIHDRIADAYYGRLGEAFMRETQRRIHWICAKVHGQRVLDLGCSQGITALLLGREGKEVVGIDVDAQAIAEARRLLEGEPVHVQRNVAFVTANATDYPFDQESFDTVVLGEVLEHLTHPEQLIETAARCLGPGGRLVVTVPFGINDWIDHKRTFYLREPYELVSTLFEVADVAVLGKWLGLTGNRRKSPSGRPALPPAAGSLLKMLEDGVFVTERALRDDLGSARGRLRKAEADYRAATEQVAQLKQKIVDDLAARSALTQELHALRERLRQEEEALSAQADRLQEERRSAAEMGEQLGELRQEIAVLRGSLEVAAEARQKATVEIEEARRKLARAEAERGALQARIEQLGAEAQLQELRLAHANEAVERLRGELAAGERDRDAASQTIADLRLQLALAEQSAAQAAARVGEIEQRTTSEGAAQRARVERLEDELKAERTAARRAEQHAIRADEELKSIRQRLDDANAKYRAATEQIALIKQRLVEAQTARDESAATAAQLAERLGAAEAALARSLSEHATSIADRDAALAAGREARAAAEEQLATLETALASLNAELAAATRSRDAADRQANELTTRLAATAGERDALATRLSDLEAMLDQAERDLAAADDVIASLRGELQRVHGEANEAVAALDVRLRASEAERDSLATRLGDLSALFNQSQRDLRAADDTLASIRVELAEARSDANRATVLADRISAFEAERDALASRLDDVTSRFDQSQRDLRAADVALESLRAECAEARAEAEQAATALADQQARLSRANAEQATGRQAIADLRRQLTEARAEGDRLSASLARAEQSLADARTRNQELGAACTQAEGAKAAAAAETIRLGSDLDTLRAQHRACLDEIKALRAGVAREQGALAKATARIGRLRAQLDVAQQKPGKVRATLSFQLGHTLIFGFKSWRGLKGLPHELWAIRQEARRRRNQTSSPPAAATAGSQTAPTKARADAGPAPHDDRRAPASATTAQRLKSLKVAAIMDEFTSVSFRDECNLLQLTPQHWRRELEAFQPELLFVESAWRGKDELWARRVGHVSEELRNLVAWCKTHKTPTVFWNKEDPVHFETFLNTARLFDFVFTTDIDCIQRYKAALGHQRVYLLPFAAQPMLHNPIESYERKDAFSFAGAYYVRYPERNDHLEDFLSALPAFRPVEIYDRNYGKNDKNYKFPENYQSLIVGNLPFDQIDRAYKGYRYAINLNSIQQSQSMFARRTYELLASNTLTVSNFSRGLRLLFGDLVICSNSGREVVRRVREACADDVVARKLRLAALRKVMREHTYQDRLAHVVSKVRAEAAGSLLPRIFVVTYAKSIEAADRLLALYAAQSYEHKSLVLVVPDGLAGRIGTSHDAVRIIPATRAGTLRLGDVARKDDWLAGMVAEDHYGPNYLLDLALATRYAKSPVIGKATRYVWSASAGLSLTFPGKQYRRVEAVPARSGVIRASKVARKSFREWAIKLHTMELAHPKALSIDEFGYCKNAAAAGFGAAERSAVEDLAGLDIGLPLAEVLSRAECIAPAGDDGPKLPRIPGPELAVLFGKAPAQSLVTMGADGDRLQICSTLADGRHEYRYATSDHKPEDLGAQDGLIRFHLETKPGLNLQLVMLFLDARRNRISHIVRTANRNHVAELPSGTAYVRLGLRVYASGSASVTALILGHRKLEPAALLTRGRHLVLTNQYPSQGDLYRNGFVHRRIVSYGERGVRADVFRLRPGEPVSYHEFENVDCITGSQEALQRLLEGNSYDSVLVHFLDPAMWEVLGRHIDRVRVVVWVHGAEIQPYHRREYNYRTDEERKTAKAQSDKRMAFWRDLLRIPPANLKLVFVSRHFADEVMENLGFRIPHEHYEIIHNPIDTELFSYQAKPAEQRNKILSIRPYASLKYANDLSVRAILELARTPLFQDLEFRMIGDGPLFDATLAPLRRFDNVIIENRFLSQAEIAKLHKDYGIFLCPTRMDSQGVSRDEAMASGLVPVTNAVAAIPEFVDDTCGILAPAEDHAALAAGIARLAENPALFAQMSAAAAQRVRRQSSAARIINAELSLFSPTAPPCSAH